ncbi:hypothetical protein HYQ46_004436 [Verticillium longisporum]|nr:hypothetical protein HYQ46_004436 [Verticillium longisporum]
MAASVTPQRPVRVGGASGGFTDRVAGIRRLAADPEVDAVVGDWLSENVMTGYGAGKARKVQSDKATTKLPLEERKKTAYYASTFLQCFEPAIPEIARNGTELVVNAGASDKELLAEVVDDMVLRGGFDMKVARVEGDDVTLSFKRLVAEGATFRSVTDERTLNEWGFDPICAQAYLGSLGIAEALRQGADIVICGRVSDSAPLIGIAAWWHNWGVSDLDELAGALVAGHLIECSVFVTAKVFSNGTCTITKEDMSNGIVNVETVTSQLVYEINGPLYFYSDVVAVLAGITLEQIDNPRNQELATVDVRIFAQAQDATLFDPTSVDGFARKLYGTVLQSCPGVSRSNDLRQSAAKIYWEYFVTSNPQSVCEHRVHFLYGDKPSINIPAPPITYEYGPQKSYETEETVPCGSFGDTIEAPLGYIALGRSGDKASDANVGFFVSGAEEWDWLRSFLTANKIQELLGPEEYHSGRIDRFEMKNIRAVHFLLKDHLDRGYNSGSKLDTLAKILCEYLRAKHVPIPREFLRKGHL